MQTTKRASEIKTPGLAVDAGARPERRKIQSVDRALSLLELLADESEGVRLNDISKALNLNVSTCHHLLGTLMERGYVAQSGKDRSYFLGNKVSELSGSHMRQFNLADVAMGDLRSLNEQTGETVHLAVLQADELMTVSVLDSRHAVRVVSGPGGKANAIHATATGKAILAWLPETEIERLIKRQGLPRFTENTIVDRTALLEDLRQVRRNGYSVDNEEFQPGVICIGAAIRDHAGAVVGAFSCSMPTMRAGTDCLDAVQDAVKETTRSIADGLGGIVAADAKAAE